MKAYAAPLRTVRAATMAAGAAAGVALAILLALANPFGSGAGVSSVGVGAARPAAARGLSSLPAAAQEPVAAALGRTDRGYWVHGLSASNPAQGLRLGFSSAGVTLRGAAGSGSSGRLSLVGFGRLGALTSLRPVAPVAPVARANRVSYHRGALTEWYANGPLGLEQGFDIARAPSGNGPLALRLALTGGLRISADHGGLVFSGHGTSLRYGQLAAYDARGRRLPASMTLARGGRLTISVDARGAAYPVRVDPLVQQAELTFAAGAAQDQLGTAVAISGNTIVAGAPSVKVGTNLNQGALYVFTKPSTGWANAGTAAELTVAGGAASDNFGRFSLAVSGNTIVAGDPAATVGANARQGAAFVFVEPSTGWKNATQSAELTASNGAANAGGGYIPVAIDANTIAMGTPFYDAGGQAQAGAVYVFTKPPSGWSGTLHETAELTIASPAPQDALGLAVGISGNVIAAGAQLGDTASGGGVFVFTAPSGDWTHTSQVELTAAPSLLFSGTSEVAISGGTIAVGNTYATVGANMGQGAVYEFTEPQTGWASSSTPTATLTASDGASADGLGFTVAVSGTTIVAGAESHKVGANLNQGAAYVFNEPTTGWANGTQTQELTAADGAAVDFLGYSVAIDSGIIVAGAPHHTVGANRNQGTAYVFEAPGGGGGGGGGPTAVPANITRPAISGTAKAGKTLTCAPGTWTQSPTHFAYLWNRDSTPIAGATSSKYKVGTSDEQLALTCAVTASNAKGPSKPAVSRDVKVPVPHVAKCPAATGSLSGEKLGLIHLGMTRAQARKAYKHSSNRGKKYEDFFCLTPIGVRVGYASPTLLKTLAKGKRSKYEGRVIWASTSSAYYSVKHVRVGATIASAAKPLKTGAVFHVGVNDWYIAPNGASSIVLKVRHGLIEEIGIGDKALTQGRKAQNKFLRSFS